MDKRILHIAALKNFDGKLKEEAAMLQETFEILDEGVEKLEHADAPLSWIAGHTLRKAGSTSLSMYNAILEERLSERRAHLYSLSESLELLIYIIQRSQVDDEIHSSKSSAAGETAKQSSDSDKRLCEGLNTYAAQLDYSIESLRQVLPSNREHRGTEKSQDLESIRAELKIFFRVLMRLIIEGVNCLALVSGSDESIFFKRLQTHIEQSSAVFGPLEEGSDFPSANAA